MGKDEEELKEQVPADHQLFNPTLQALRDLGGSGSNDEIAETVTNLLEIPEPVAQVSHLGSTTQTELEYKLAWARTYLKKYGLINNSQRGVWVLTPKGRDAEEVDPAEVKRYVRELEEETETPPDDPETGVQPTPHDEFELQERLLTILKKIPPDAFERLCQRILRESGFVQVQVTDRSGDGGIDGHGVIRLEGMLTFPVVFQCKRYDGSVGPNVVRELRGSMVGKADRGLVLTTGRFTKGAIEEANRDGAPPIDLMDGEALVELLKDLELGVEPVERYEINRDWFDEV